MLTNSLDVQRVFPLGYRVSTINPANNRGRGPPILGYGCRFPRGAVMKTCTFCHSPAILSLCVIASTLGRKPRLQENTESVAVCRACLKIGRVWEGVAGSTGLKERVNTAADALTRRSDEGSQPISEKIEAGNRITEARGSAPASLSLPIRD